MFVDASAIVAIISREPDGDSLRFKMEAQPAIFISAITVYEAALGLTRRSQGLLVESLELVRAFLREADAQYVEIDRAVGDLALEAHARFGRGRHKAALNMGDCFSYACARSRGVPLLCKGDDFRHTDIAIA